MLNSLADPHTLATILVAVATFATILSVALPMVSPDRLDKRMKSVASERERIRLREREKLKVQKTSLRYEPKAYMKRVVDRFNLSEWLGTTKAKSQMASAGFRGAQAETAFLFFRLVSPISFIAISAIYVFVIGVFDWPMTV